MVAFAASFGDPTADSIGIFWAYFIPALIVDVGVLAYFDGGRSGATPGKRLRAIRVVDEASGGSIGYPRAVLRRIVYLLGFFALGVGLAWALIKPRHQAWHDKAARSLVVYGSQSEYSMKSAVLLWVAAAVVAGGAGAFLAQGTYH
jgi:uncharacterized RDD family membrane protein YckC